MNIIAGIAQGFFNTVGIVLTLFGLIGCLICVIATAIGAASKPAVSSRVARSWTRLIIGSVAATIVGFLTMRLAGGGHLDHSIALGTSFFVGVGVLLDLFCFVTLTFCVIVELIAHRSHKLMVQITRFYLWSLSVMVLCGIVGGSAALVL